MRGAGANGTNPNPMGDTNIGKSRAEIEGRSRS